MNPDWRNVAKSSVRVDAGTYFSADVSGGHIRRKLPVGGWIVKDHAGKEIFVPDTLFTPPVQT